MEISIFQYMQKYDYENILLCQDNATGLNAIIAVHDTCAGYLTRPPGFDVLKLPK